MIGGLTVADSEAVAHCQNLVVPLEQWRADLCNQGSFLELGEWSTRLNDFGWIEGQWSPNTSLLQSVCAMVRCFHDDVF